VPPVEFRPGRELVDDTVDPVVILPGPEDEEPQVAGDRGELLQVPFEFGFEPGISALCYIMDTDHGDRVSGGSARFVISTNIPVIRKGNPAD
jgi:hypothetical protein